MDSYLKRELERMEKLNHKSNLLNLRTRNEYLIQCERERILNEQVEAYQSGKTLRKIKRNFDEF